MTRRGTCTSFRLEATSETDGLYKKKNFKPHHLSLLYTVFVYSVCNYCYCRLQCPLNAAVVLASYAVQSEIGDHCPSRAPGYLSKCHFIPEQNEDFLSKVEDLHPQHKGLKQSDAELCFLNTARTLELYGVELHAAMDTNNTPLMVGLASSGVAIFCNMVCSSFFPWGKIIKISFKRKRFFLHLKQKHTQDCEVPLLLLCPKTCKNLWRSCVDHHSFFSSNRNGKSPKQGNSTVQTYTKRSPRVRHEIRKPRPSSAELTADLKNMSLGEDVFYTYRASVSSSKVLLTNERLNLLNSNERKQNLIRLGKKIFYCFFIFSLSGSYSQGPDDALSHADDSIGEEDTPPYYNKDALGDGDLMLICITPDHEGKFGFNVKGGVDQKMPLSVSHIKPDSPAGRSEPKLMEGDLIVLINGRDISEHTHDQVVMFIRASRESHSRQLALLIKRKGVYKPQSPGQSERVKTLEESMRQLERGIQSGTLCFHFENLYRRKPGMSQDCSRLPENQEKNRYRDVLPYDATRVVLQSQEDYINASHITSGVCLQYIAAQGPLPQTCTHFWQTVWEQQIHTVIMLTTLTERGRTKCHQYWPHPPKAKDYGHMSVECHSEECNLAYVTRRFTLKHTQLGDERAITHLQYVAWPDHGVPDDPSDFLQFVSSVRETRDKEPLMVHCSAGIGRTGVLIIMETALTLMDGGQPVFPLEIVKTMRDQRAMMVQTTVQRNRAGLPVCQMILIEYPFGWIQLICVSVIKKTHSPYRKSY
uniref:protein-tyrosine-phosphatase n=1 Tax=Oryzias sinensis TaxID=183150 RepID=A0A8C7XKM0_9TELE